MSVKVRLSIGELQTVAFFQYKNTLIPHLPGYLTGHTGPRIE